MEHEITDVDRATLVRCAVARVGRDEMRSALARTDDASFQAPTSVMNALKALRKHRDPTAVVARPQYRAALPYLAAVVSDACLSRTIEVLGDHSDDPTREQLVTALEEVRDAFTDITVGVMLASVADADMPSSDLCFELASTDERFGLTGWADAATVPGGGPTTGKGATGRSGPADRGATAEQREARRLKKQKDAEERRRKMEAARKAGEQVRRSRKQERGAAGSGPSGAASDPNPSGADRPPASADHRGGNVAPRLHRRASLTPAEEAAFDRTDPWVAAVVFAWVPFDAPDPDQPDADGKSRRCVVVAGSPTEILVRPGYSDGGVKSRDWKSVPLRHWKRAGFDQPTWIDSETLRVPRPAEGEPVGWLEPEDWNSLW
jgi:hypothetical protein